MYAPIPTGEGPKRAIEPNALYTVPEAAALLSITPACITKKLRCGIINGKRTLGQWRVKGSELLRFG